MSLTRERREQFRQLCDSPRHNHGAGLVPVPVNAGALRELLDDADEADQLREKLAEAWEAGKLRGKEVCAWAIGNLPESERPDEANPYKEAQ